MDLCTRNLYVREGGLNVNNDEINCKQFKLLLNNLKYGTTQNRHKLLPVISNDVSSSLKLGEEQRGSKSRFWRVGGQNFVLETELTCCDHL